ncbi:hypothetical protein IW261DRAFT_1519569 [Armillaria novae-zelandiae]|uniref:F-box domain-containing protein n=1 Tax=Armillaria novae-zelandiae TaxID=153914 RepID=A0AA39NKT6_9AGAR|nr:hypothetical protein IW261DRAFT_1519569 [Armillaria novae-zelandiae]
MDTSSRLPLELLLESFDFSDGLWVLGQVNRTWRSPVLSDKSLWSTINMAVDYPPHVSSTSSGVSTDRIIYDEAPMDDIHTIVPTPMSNQILTYILLRSKDMPLTISLHFPTKSPELDEVISSTWRPLFSVFLAESRRLRTLDLFAPSPIWGDFAKIPLARLPLLQKVSELAAEARFAADSRDGRDAVYMPRLCELEASTWHVLDAITAPNLRSLTVTNKSFITRTPFRVPPIVDFIRRSGCPLTNLELHWDGTADELFDLLHSMPTVESLSFFHNYFEVAFDTRMKSLSSVLPKLRAFSIQRDGAVRHRERFVNMLVPLLDAIPVIDVIESMLAGGILESVNIGLVVVDVLSEAARKRLSILNATPGVTVEIRQWSSDISGWSFYDRLDSVFDYLPATRTEWSIHQR